MTLVAFFTCAGLIAYVYIVYPLLLCTLAVLFGRRSHPDEAYTPTVSVLIPAYNEEEVIAQKIENTLALDYPREQLEVIIASESNDGTDATVRDYAVLGVKLLSSLVRRGKVANLKRAVSESRGEILLLTDANVMVYPDALRKIVRHFADERIASVSGRLRYVTPGGRAAEKSEEVYWEIEHLLKWASSRLFSLPGATGALFAIRHQCYQPITENRGDDFELPIRCLLDGYGSILEQEAVSIEEATGGFLQVYRRKVRISNWMFRSALILLWEAVQRGRGLLIFQLTHRITRWMIPLWLIGLFVSSLFLADRGGIFQAVAAAQVGFYTLAFSLLIVNHAVSPIKGWLGVPAYFMTVSAASLVGVITCLLGHTVPWYKTR